MEEIVKCGACSARNRLQSGWQGLPKCGKCGQPLPIDSHTYEPIFKDDHLRPAAPKARKLGFVIIGVMVAFALGIGYVLGIQQQRGANGILPAVPVPSAPESNKKTLTLDDLDKMLPSTPVQPPGKSKTFAETHTPVKQAPGVILQRIKTPKSGKLTIRTSTGSDYYVQLLAAGTTHATVGIYVTGGKTMTFDVPLGRLVYATGANWYGKKDRFGPGSMTSYAKADKPFEFKGYSNGADHWTVELILQQGGNLQTEAIDESQFGD